MTQHRLGIALSLLAVAAGMAFFIYSGSSRTVERPGTVRTAVPSPSVKPISQLVKSECVSFERFVQSPEAYKLDEWFLSWGAPPIANTALLSRPYEHYGVEVLESLAGGGDSVALHELGLDLVWAALSQVNALPNYTTLWDLGDEEHPYTSTIDSEKLRQGRDDLFQSAVMGRTYSLVEIGLSYSHERIIRERNGTATADELQELRISAYGYGKSLEMLIQELGPAFYQSSIPVDAKEEAENLVKLVTGEVLAERRKIDLAETLAAERAPRGFDFCIESDGP